VGGWSIIGVAVDSSARSRGEQLAPHALRAAGIVQRLSAEDRGDVPAAIDDVDRDERTGVIAYSQILEANRLAREAVRRIVEGGSHPLVLGGDCSFLPGALAGASPGDSLGLCLVDGHVDAYDGRNSPSGEAADMPLAVALGRGPSEWTRLAGRRPIVVPEDVVALGHRTDLDDLEEIALVPPEVTRHSAAEILNSDPKRIGRSVAERLSGLAAGFWLHFDTDVLDEAEMPASTYTATGGLRWDHLEAMLGPLLGSPVLVGLSIADFRPDLDPQGRYARQIVAFFASKLAGRPG
jgi:arginase